MTPTKLLVGQIFVVFAIVIAGVWAATQWCAAQLGYHAQLGPAWFMAGETPVYRPWAIFPWWYHFEAYAPEIFDKAGMLAGASGFLGCAAAIAGSLWRARQSGHVTTYGSARWATDREIDRAGLTGEAGVFIGRKRGRYLRHDGPEHVMAFAPTRSGKGVGLVVPTLLSWTGSAVIHDIKGENWQLTAGWRARFGHALLFNPTDPASAKYNPLLEVRRGAQEVRDVQNIADILVDPEGALERRNHWEKTSHSLLVGAILHILYAEQDKTLARVASLADIADSSIAPAIIESCPQRILLPNDRAIEPQSQAAYRRFGLNARQIELVSRAVPKRQYYLQSARGNRLFELGLGPIALALCGASDPETQKRIDAIEAKLNPFASGGRDPAAFARAFLADAGLDWAADLLTDFPSPQAPQEGDF